MASRQLNFKTNDFGFRQAGWIEMRRSGGLSFYKKRKVISKKIVVESVSWIFGILSSVVLAIVLVYCVGMKASVIGVSMENSLYNGQEILTNRFVYQLFPPKRNDVIVFLPNGNQNTHYYIKRVVGLPGETIQIKEDGKLYINGIPQEDSIFDKIADPGIAENEIKLANDEYFVLGDNRNNSEDSRSGNIGPVKKSTITGKAWFHMAYGEGSAGFVK